CHPQAITRLLKVREWTPARRMLLQQLHGSLVAARARRTMLHRHMTQEIVAEEALLRLTRLCGINLMTLYGVVAAVAYLGLNPSVSQSRCGFLSQSGPCDRQPSSAKSVGVGAVCQRLMPTGKQSGLLMRIATTESVLLCMRMKS